MALVCSKAIVVWYQDRCRDGVDPIPSLDTLRRQEHVRLDSLLALQRHKLKDERIMFAGEVQGHVQAPASR